jgi:glycerol-1-phosphate dehydrogenase [NAD(P)+]
MITPRQIAIPTLVRAKPGALDRLGIYARRHEFRRVALLHSHDLLAKLRERVEAGLAREGIELVLRLPVNDASFEQAEGLLRDLPSGIDALIGLGGGKALDVAKYLGFLSRLPYLAVPTSLSNDGFCSPQSSLTLAGKRRSLPAAMPFGVVIDTEVCLQAPDILWCSGVGDLAAKFTAVRDWKLAFHAKGTPVDDFAALLSDATAFQFLGRPMKDQEGVRLLGTALLLNGISMAIGGSSRPVSGSEHLISHALDATCERPRLHGLQVGVAAYLVSLLQQHDTDRIAALFDATGFWSHIQADPFSRQEWLHAAQLAPTIKAGYYTILSERDWLPEIAKLMDSDPRLKPCFKP